MGRLLAITKIIIADLNGATKLTEKKRHIEITEIIREKNMLLLIMMANVLQLTRGKSIGLDDLAFGVTDHDYHQLVRRSKDLETNAEDEMVVGDWVVYAVVIVLIILPILGILYCACKSTMPATASVSPAPRQETTN